MPRTSARLVALAVTALASTALGTGCAHAARGMEVGIQDDGVFLGHYSNRDVAFRLSHRLVVTRVRTMVQWSKVLGAQAAARRPPRQPAYDFSQFDTLATAAAANGMKLQLVLTGPAPAFASGDHRVGPVRPNARLFGQFAAAAALHFKGVVDRYSIWNEPNHKGWLQPVVSSPRIYRALYSAGYRAIKHADPAAKVLIGETVPYSIHGGRTAMAPLAFLRAMLCVDRAYRHRHCPGLRADGYAHHPYDFTHPPAYRYPGADNVTIGTLGRLTSALDRLARIHALRPPGARMDVYLSEYGYFAAGRRRVPEAMRKRWLPQAFAIALANPRVRELLQYLLVRPPAGQPGEGFATYLTDRKAKPLPTFNTLAAFNRREAKAGAIVTTPR